MPTSTIIPANHALTTRFKELLPQRDKHSATRTLDGGATLHTNFFIQSSDTFLVAQSLSLPGSPLPATITQKVDITTSSDGLLTASATKSGVNLKETMICPTLRKMLREFRI